MTLFGAYTTTARTIQLARADIAIPLALGATNAITIRRFAGEVGLVAVAAVFADNIATPFLSLTSASEPSVYFAVLLGLPVIAFGAAVLASRAITRISPVAILKSA